MLPDVLPREKKPTAFESELVTESEENFKVITGQKKAKNESLSRDTRDPTSLTGLMPNTDEVDDEEYSDEEKAVLNADVNVIN